MEITNFIKKRRKELRINQEILAKLLKLSVGAYSRREKTMSFTLDQLKLLCSVLKLEIFVIPKEYLFATDANQGDISPAGEQIPQKATQTPIVGWRDKLKNK